MKNKNVKYKGFINVFKDGIYEIVNVSDSIAVLIYDKNTDQFVFVKQLRPAMKYIHQTDTIDLNGILLEVPAGRFDYNATAKQLIVNEIKEETGIIITEDDVELLNYDKALALSPGVLTEMMFLAYVEIDSSVNEFDRSKFYGVEDEQIERILVPVQDILTKMIFKDMKTFALIQWFFANKYNK